VICGLGENLAREERGALLEHPGTRTADALEPDALAGGPQVAVESADDLVVCVHRVADGAAVHVLRYAYDDAADAVPPLRELDLELRLPMRLSTASAVSPDGRLQVELVAAEGRRHRLRLRDLSLYGIVRLT
jgi:hypothetical protein